MTELQACPSEVLDLVIEQLVIVIGIQKAVLLRTVSRAFDAAIRHAITVHQVVDLDDPATPCLANRMRPELRGQIIAAKSRSTTATPARVQSYVSVVSRVNQMLDKLLDEEDQELRRRRHEAIAQAVIPVRDVDPETDDEEDCVWEEIRNMVGRDPPRDDVQVEAQNLLSGAVIAGNLPLLKALLQQHPNERFPSSLAGVNGSTPYFPTLLRLAITWGHVEVVRHLLSCGALIDPNSRTWRARCSPCSQEDWPAHHDKDLHNAIDCIWTKSGSSSSKALYDAVRYGQGDIIRLLLRPEHRLLPLSSMVYMSAIQAGAQAGRPDLIDALLEMIGRQLSDFAGLDTELLWSAVQNGHQDLVRKLLDAGAVINAIPDGLLLCQRQYYGALPIAASRGGIDMVRLLLERGADVNKGRPRKPGHLPIQIAARSGHEEVVQLLLGHGADSRAAVLAAAEGGQPRVLQALLGRYPGLLRGGVSGEGGETGEDGTSWLAQEALRRALKTGNLTFLAILVKEASVDKPGRSLQFEMKKTYPWVARYLTSLGVEETESDDHDNGGPAFDETEHEVRGVCVSERTWEWVSKY
ncbi:hypothetical protein PG985_008181 [Apiospora marii]|uniref:F-box domain-containing protein n=1 Tax=Apiospora marii TaxID=335849 RepID=A0ABR1R9X4_9PEZI